MMGVPGRFLLELSSGSPQDEQWGREGGSGGWEQCLLEDGHQHPDLFPAERQCRVAVGLGPVGRPGASTSRPLPFTLQ